MSKINLKFFPSLEDIYNYDLDYMDYEDSSNKWREKATKLQERRWRKINELDYR